MIFDRIVSAILGFLVHPRPVLVFLAGPNGAGKSTFFELYLDPALGSRLPFVNADEIGAAIQAVSTSGSENLDRLAFTKAEELRQYLLAGRLSFCTETVFSDPEGAKLDFLRRARTSGYAVFLVFIGLDDPQLSAARVMQRVEAGGHDVPDEKLWRRFPRTLANLKAAIGLVDEVFVFDNSSVDEPFRPVAVYAGGELVERFARVPPWANDLPGL